MEGEFMDAAPIQDLKSKFDSGIAQLYRIDELWRECHKQKRSYNLFLWNIALDSLWCELSSDSKEEEYIKFLEFNKALLINGFFTRKEIIGFATIDRTELNKQAVHYQLLIQKEIWLRKLLNKQGKGTRYEDPLDSYMD